MQQQPPCTDRLPRRLHPGHLILLGLHSRLHESTLLSTLQRNRILLLLLWLSLTYLSFSVLWISGRPSRRKVLDTDIQLPQPSLSLLRQENCHDVSKELDKIVAVIRG